MITFIEGKLIEKSPAHAVIDCNGVGYLLHITLNTYSKIDTGKICKLHTHYAVSVEVRSGASNHSLYGFFEPTERALFQQLISVSGVSSNIARTILSSVKPSELQHAVLGNDVNLIQSVKGIGPKLAQRIILELKEKLNKLGMPLDYVPIEGNTIQKDALTALCSLGFDKSKAQNAINDVLKKNGQDLLVEDLIKESLKVL